jgi:hypothetical protein
MNTLDSHGTRIKTNRHFAATLRQRLANSCPAVLEVLATVSDEHLIEIWLTQLGGNSMSSTA